MNGKLKRPLMIIYRFASVKIQNKQRIANFLSFTKILKLPNSSFLINTFYYKYKIGVDDEDG